MASLLKQVLEVFEGQRDRAMSTAQIARRLGVQPAMLDEMLAYWVRKGKLREVSHAEKGCNTCGAKTGCPFIMAMPKQYELATEREPVFSSPSCELHETTCDC